MLKTIPADEAFLNGKALTVRYREDQRHPDLLIVNIASHNTEDNTNFIQKYEVIFVVIQEHMSRAAMHARVAAEAERRHIERVAWVREL